MQGTSHHRNDILDLLLEDVKREIRRMTVEGFPDNLQMQLLNVFNGTNQFCERLLHETRMEMTEQVDTLIKSGRAEEVD